MDNILFITIITLLIATVIVTTTFIITKKIQKNKYKKQISTLDIERNTILGIPILSEISKVKDLVKTENLQTKLNDWDATFKLIKEEYVPEVADLISEADFLINKREYKLALKKIANIEMEIKELKSKSNYLLDEIKIVTTSEERNRVLITKLKVIFRELQNKFERTKKDYGEIIPSLVLQFETMEKRFVDFENFMEKNDYVEVEKIVVSLEELINKTKILLEDSPSVILMATLLIPKKIDEVSLSYSRMIRDGYPLDYLNIEYNIEQITVKINSIMDNLKMLNLGNSEMELKTILNYLNNLYKDFDREKESKNIFKENSKIFKRKIDKLNKIVYNVYLSLDDIKKTYDLKDDEINKFNIINEKLEIMNKDFKALVEHSRGKTFAFSKLVEELDILNNKLTRLQEDLDFQLSSISSMHDDESRAKEQLDTIENLLRNAKYKIKEYKLPVIPDSYFVELKEAQDAIKEIIKELEKKPIVIKILNIRVDTARDLVFKIYNKTNDMLKEAMMAEKIIVYGNRYRSSYLNIDEALTKAEQLFKKGLYKQSLNTSINAIEIIENGIGNDYYIDSGK